MVGENLVLTYSRSTEQEPVKVRGTRKPLRPNYTCNGIWELLRTACEQMLPFEEPRMLWGRTVDDGKRLRAGVTTLVLQRICCAIVLYDWLWDLNHRSILFSICLWSNSVHVRKAHLLAAITWTLGHRILILILSTECIFQLLPSLLNPIDRDNWQKELTNVFLKYSKSQPLVA